MLPEMPESRLMYRTRQLPLCCEAFEGRRRRFETNARVPNNSLVLCETGGSCNFLFLNGEADEMADQSLYDLQAVYGSTSLMLRLRLLHRLPEKKPD
jgi:hypothetical protein